MQFWGVGRDDYSNENEGHFNQSETSHGQQLYEVPNFQLLRMRFHLVDDVRKLYWPKPQDQINSWETSRLPKSCRRWPLWMRTSSSLPGVNQLALTHQGNRIILLTVGTRVPWGPREAACKRGQFHVLLAHTTPQTASPFRQRIVTVKTIYRKLPNFWQDWKAVQNSNSA